MPPFVGSVKVRVRDCLPLPHDLVQVDQAVKVPILQSVAHACWLQARVSALCGHFLPPSIGGTRTRLLRCEPVPHDLVQVDQAAQPLVTQSVEHVCSLQLRVSARYGHT